MTVEERAEEWIENDYKPSGIDNFNDLKQAYTAGYKEALKAKVNVTFISDAPLMEKEQLKRARELLEEFCSYYMYDCDATREDKTYEAFEELKEESEAFLEELKELQINEDRLCEHCDQYKSFPDGKRCRSCDDGSKWKRGK